ncbi:ribose-5-phosphate isomerase RpiA [[Ruminococcus] lactaris]|mgnify:CR=1 FL=1|uniref:ribose-5-phosphate isomerase RpiA n=1 Tax=[Ruminococcus] lactaris TaxID=46228 RepID=UPI0026DB1288|nr:ribose-5-phosphate isomerase RpiA [[Ruminococcus] lactaris]
MKKKCAEKAAKMIKDGMIVGLGGGSTVGFLIEELAGSGKKIQAVTPSMDTEELCREHGIEVLPLSRIAKIDIAFDGCDELDQNFNALKSCGGIHTREKLVADMAEDYILLADETKYYENLPFAYPVTVEVLPCARSYVKEELQKLGAEVTERHCSNKTGLTVTDDGNYLMEAKFSNVEDAEQLNHALNAMSGVVGHGFFYQVASGAIITGKNEVKILHI